MATLDLIQQFANSGHPLEQKFLASRLQVAWNILPETTGANLVARQAWARKIFTDYRADCGKEYRWFLSHANVQAAGVSITDANCVAAVASFVDNWA